MRIQVTTRSFRRIKPWRAMVLLSMFSLAFSLLAELLLHPKGSFLNAIEFLELSALLVIFIDLAVNFSRASNKRRFLRHNWMELMLFVPFSFIFHAVRVYEVFEVMGIQAMPFLLRTKLFVKSGHMLAKAGRTKPALAARMAVSEAFNAPDRYRTMRYRGLLSP